jgi:hypothetical protein
MSYFRRIFPAAPHVYLERQKFRAAETIFLITGKKERGGKGPTRAYIHVFWAYHLHTFYNRPEGTTRHKM